MLKKYLDKDAITSVYEVAARAHSMDLQTFLSIDKATRREIINEALKDVPALLPCPFCGGSPVYNTPTKMINFNHLGSIASIECKNCELKLEGNYFDGIKETWNRRNGKYFSDL